ncbi:MAG: methionine biosynthesis PLP-dependent protein [Defluviitaleaceae bacterium]|nr:methionine biosynthesis PLP-dependent protein [Defluviitaleaceae bacterium]
MANLKVASKLAQIGNRSCSKTGAINPPVYFSTAYSHNELGHSTGYDYTRTKNPTRDLLEATIAELEGGDRGFACSSGMAAIQTLLSIFSSGDELVVSSDLYGGTYRLLETGFRRWGMTATYVDTSKLSEIEAALTPQTKAIFVETPTNPMMIESDIEAIGKLAKANELLLIVDNTFYTPILQRPIELGADIVIHSATKYLGGHNDVLAGLIVTKGEQLGEDIFLFHNGAGAVLGPFDCWLLMRGMKTLALRLRQQEANAKQLVTYLTDHPFVTDVFYPGKGGMISFRIQMATGVDPFLKSLSLITFAESLGGTESFITYPKVQTHADIPEELRLAVGVCDRLLRFSVGIEDVADLIVDLEQAFAQAKQEV